MGDVVQIGSRRRGREARMLADADHPARRWTAGGDDRTGHRRRGEGTVCALAGPLELAGRDVTRCAGCYPPTIASDMPPG